MELKAKDKEVLEFIKRFMVENGYCPTIREIGKGVNLHSTSSVYQHFIRLADFGYIEQMSCGHSFRYKVKGMKYVDDVQ